MDESSAEESWSTRGRRVVYRGRMTVAEHTVRLPSGRTEEYEVDESVPFAVATLVCDGAHVLLTRQYRYPIDQWIFDLPGGAGEAGEEPDEAARRELEEELGLVAEDLRPLHSFYVNPGRSAPVHVFACTSTTEGIALVDDPAEQVRLVSMPLARLDALIAARRIVDPTLLIARTMAAAITGLLPQIEGR